MKRLAILLILCLPLITGCNLAVTERQTFVLCLSLDVDQEGKLTLGVLTPMNGEGASTGAAPNYTFFSAQGEDFPQTLSTLAASTPCPLNFCQVRLCVLSYDLAARRELRPLLMDLASLHSMRPDAVVMIALGQANETIKAITPDFGMRMSTNLNIYLERMETLGLSPGTSITQCVRDLDSGRIDPLLSVCAVNPAVKKKQESEKSQGGSEGSKKPEDAAVFAGSEPWSGPLVTEGLLAGALPREGINPVEYLGSAAVGNGRVSGLLDARETEIVLRLRKSAQLSLGLEGEDTQLIVRLSRQGQAADITPEDAMQALEKLQVLRCDALGFGGVCAGTVYTNGEWEQIGFELRYPRAKIRVGE